VSPPRCRAHALLRVFYGKFFRKHQCSWRLGCFSRPLAYRYVYRYHTCLSEMHVLNISRVCVCVCVCVCGMESSACHPRMHVYDDVTYVFDDVTYVYDDVTYCVLAYMWCGMPAHACISRAHTHTHTRTHTHTHTHTYTYTHTHTLVYTPQHTVGTDVPGTP